METAVGRSGPQRLHVRAYPSSSGALGTEISISTAPEAFSGSPGSCVALVPALFPGGLGRHKWHDRRVLADRRELLGLRRHEQLLLLDEDGSVLETEAANVFAVLGGVVRTPPVDGRVLAGTTREAVLRVATAEGFEVSDEPFALRDLASAEEVFLTSSIRGVCAVEELRGSGSVGTGSTGARLAKALWASWNRAPWPPARLVPAAAPEY